MGIDIGFNSQTPSLPVGGGAIGGLGETFTPDLSSGTGSYTIRLDTPNGPNDTNPELSLRYDSGSGNGPFGLGFSLPLPRLLLSTARSFPRYDNHDPLMLEGAGELLRLADGSYRPEIDAGAWHTIASGDGFRVTDREGRYHFLGTNSAARITGPAPEQIFSWQIETIVDALGNTVQFTWRRDGEQLYPDTVSYGPYQLIFAWESRPDIIRSGRTGFLVVTALRCAAIELHLPGAAQPLLRRWSLNYAQDETNGVSLLRSVTMSGFDEDLTQLDTPTLQLKYTRFATRSLTPFTSDADVEPGPLQRMGRRMELVDWNGNGLPDLLEIAAGGTTRLWPNLGECIWGRPRPLPDLPLFASADAAVAFADINGDGVADMFRTDRFADGYVRRVADRSIGRHVRWQQVPGAARTLGTNSRLVDLDGDGRVDLLVSTNSGLETYYQTGEESWEPMPRQLARGNSPVLNLADPHVFLADMSGSGSSDLVRVDGRGVRWWPYLGFGKWALPVEMTNPPEFPFDLNPERLFLSDVDGDGCADLVYLDQGRVVYWINQSGNGFSPPHVIDYVPTGNIRDARLADMRGSGTAGLLWSTSGPFGRGTRYFYLDFSGDAKPHLLENIDNGIGLVTRIAYTTSARAAAEDARAQQPWETFLPIVVPIISEISTQDQVTGQTTRTQYRYFNGRYDGVLREFAGFGRVEQDEIGDINMPTLRTTSWFHIGVDPDQPQEPSEETRRRLRAIRGRLFRKERSAPDAPGEGHFDRLEQDWFVDVDLIEARAVYVPRLARMRESVLDGVDGVTVVSSIATTNLSWDTSGNVTETVQTSSDGVEEKTLRTVNTYAVDPSGRFLSRLTRSRQFDTGDNLVADTVNEYDHVAEGTVGEQGLVTRRSALVIQDSQVIDVYGASQPDFMTLGYHRRPDSDGWWAFLSAYDRQIVDGKITGTVIGPRGASTQFTFDVTGMFPEQLTTPTGNAIHVGYDLRTASLAQLTEAAGNVYTVRQDALARIVKTIDPGDTEVLPTWEYIYSSATLPTEVRQRRRADSGAANTIDTCERFDGTGRLLERRITDEEGEIVLAIQQFNARGLLSQIFLEHRAVGNDFVVPAPDAPHVQFRYDALGRITETLQVDGSMHSFQYGPNWIAEADEESNRSDGAALHAGKVIRRVFDATGRVRTIEQWIGDRIIPTHYEYDIKGNLIRHLDALGNSVQFTHDLLERTIRTVRPEQATITILDAAGNPVETRSGTEKVHREYDSANRLIAEDTGGISPTVSYTWHDATGPIPADGDAFSVGHLLRIDDAGGTTRFGYDARGRVTRKRWTPVGGGTERILDFVYRSDDQPSRIVYPDGGAGRLALTYTYSIRGLLSKVSSVINSFAYDLAGRRISARYANNTTETLTYDSRGRMTSSRLNGPGGVLRQLDYVLDHVGNLTDIVSPDPKLTAHYEYDDFYRLTAASHGSGESWAYAYDDAGRLTHKSDVGDYQYGGAGIPATCLQSAGADTFTYSSRGEMQQTPWGTQHFDPYGRLVRIDSNGDDGGIDFTYNAAGKRVTARSQGNIGPSVDLVTPDDLYSLEDGQLVLNLAGCARLTADNNPVFLHRDHLGGLAVVTDAAGSVVEQLYYDPYGTLLERIGSKAGGSAGFGSGIADDWSGLLYLQARYYHPRLGQFISSDSIVGDIYDPLSWATYAYCRGNPVSYADPSGHSFWRVFILVVAIVALVALTIVTFGSSAIVAAAIGIGVLAGGVVGGISAARAKGDAGDIVTGVLVGMAVGGWAAFASAGISGLIIGKLGTGIVGSAVAGGLGGAVNGTAMGFAAGFGAKSSAGAILNLMWQSALAGLVTGAALGALTGAVQSGDIKKPDLNAEYENKVNSFNRMESGAKPPSPNMSGRNPDLPTQPSQTSASAALGKGTAFATSPLVKYAEYSAGIAGALVPVQVGVADAAGGTWGIFHDDITTYLRRHNVNIDFT